MRISFLVPGFLIITMAATGQLARSPSMLPNPGSETVAVHGEISSVDSHLTLLIVEFRSASRGLPERADVNPDGSFDIGSLTPGVYQLFVSSSGGIPLYQEQVNLRNPHENLFVRLPPTPATSPKAEGTVSIQQLQHNVPKAAQIALKRARDAVRNGRIQAALSEFHQAIRIDPEFVDAYVELGCWYVSTGELHQAVE